MSFTTWGTATLASATLVTGMLAGSVALAPSATAAPTSCDALEVIAHRGDKPDGIDQNTAPAFDLAQRGGYSIEADVWVDAEGVLWLFHDRSTLKATGTPGLINQMTTAEVEQLRYRKAGSPLLRLDAAMDTFQTYPDTRVYLEPKVAYLADDVANLVVARGLTTSTWITEHGDLAREAQPAVQVVEKINGTLPKRLTRFVRDGIGIVAAPAGRLVPKVVARYQRRGIEVQSRNARSTASWRRTIQAGADAQLTSLPAELTRFCPVALKAPKIQARKSGRTSARSLAIRGKFFYDVLNLRVADRTVRYTVVSPRRIDARIKGIRAKQVSVFVRTPNGAVERTVRIARR